MAGQFAHAPEVWARFASLHCSAWVVSGIDTATPPADTTAALAPWLDRARQRLAAQAEGEWPSISAWRRTFSAMGLKPTQYRCAAEALLRRLRKENGLPTLHPLVDAYNAVSVAWGLPIAALDLAAIHGSLTVRPAAGGEAHTTFGGDNEPAEAGEIIFADDADHAHARRWCHKQSARSAISSATGRALVVVEGQHADAAVDVAQAAQELAALLQGWGMRCTPVQALSAHHPAVPWG